NIIWKQGHLYRKNHKKRHDKQPELLPDKPVFCKRRTCHARKHRLSSRNQKAHAKTSPEFDQISRTFQQYLIISHQGNSRISSFPDRANQHIDHRIEKDQRENSQKKNPFLFLFSHTSSPSS